MTTIAEWYRRVNDTWGDAEIPKPTNEEAIAGVKKLYRFMFGESWSGEVKIGTGSTKTYPHGGVLWVNPDRKWYGTNRVPDAGWKDIVHLMSHYGHWKLNPGVRPHGRQHAQLEIRLIKEVLKRGWLAGSLRRPAKPDPEPLAHAAVDPKVSARAERLRRVEERLRRWQTKAKRAKTAIAKLERSRRGLQRAQAAAGATAGA